MLSGGPETSRLRKRPSATASSDARSAWLSRYSSGNSSCRSPDPRRSAGRRRGPGAAGSARARLHLDRERARHDLQVELPVVAGGDLVEAVVAVGDHPGEDVEAAGRALRVGLGADLVGQARAPRSAAPGRAGRARASRRRAGRPSGRRAPRSSPRPSSRVGQEAAAQRPGEVAEAQVDARGLDRLQRHTPVSGRDQPLCDRLAQTLGG